MDSVLKLIVIIFLVLFSSVCLFQLSFTFKNNQIENEASEFAFKSVSDKETDYDIKRTLKRLKYLDSLKHQRSTT